MKFSLKIYILIVFFTCCISHAYSQYTNLSYQDPLQGVASMEDFSDPFAFSITYQEAPYPDGENESRELLRKIKLEAQLKTPLNHNQVTVQNRGSVPVPEILASFSGNNIITGTPLDNHLAVNASEQIISTINTHMLVVNSVGFWLGSYKLDVFFQTLGGVNRYFDPRIIYDPQQDRFIMVIFQGSVCNESRILIAFSQSNNPKGAWNMYAIDGCIDDDGTFADFPMISLTDSELFLTYNEVNADSSWQTGFAGTQIHQIDKMNGYNGETLNRKVWRDISFNGKLLRNICPVRNADESLPTDMYFMSDRNFAISNDSVFLIHLTGHHDDPTATLSLQLRMLDHPYGVAGYALQPKDSLDTNDARILDAFSEDGHIQWVNNTMDFSTGRSGVFHGILTIDDPTEIAKGHIIGSASDYLGYPGIAWTGTQKGEQDAIIVVSHSSSTRFPGGSALYYDGNGGYSDLVTLIEGTRSVDMLPGGIERWGDYAGIQRLYHQPGSVWVANSYGRQGNRHEAWVSKLARPEEMTGTHDQSGDNVKINTYPNPVTEEVQIDIDNPSAGKISVTLFDLSGRQIKILYDGPLNFPGKASISFSTHELPAGQYEVQVKVDGLMIAVKSVVKM
ncbi:MAG: T9SS type A sorting domain-containing protein [Saprospiraceae bacterium]